MLIRHLLQLRYSSTILRSILDNHVSVADSKVSSQARRFCHCLDRRSLVKYIEFRTAKQFGVIGLGGEDAVLG